MTHMRSEPWAFGDVPFRLLVTEDLNTAGGTIEVSDLICADREMAITGDWPLHTYLRLGALPNAVPCARLHVRQMLWEWGIDGITDTAELLVSELVTNALKASQAQRHGNFVRFWLLSDKVRLVVLVWDAHADSPRLRDVSADDESGRGLLLVDALADAWNWYPHPALRGKVVWCELALTG
jgi:anti-sigma regulatory factor (Ser/Thr protein kinase)